MNSDDINAQLANVRTSYIESLADKKLAMLEHWNVLKVDWNEQSYQDLYIIIHSLAGSAGTFDLPDITEYAKDIVNLFKECNPEQNTLTDKLIKETQIKIERLIQSMEHAH